MLYRKFKALILLGWMMSGTTAPFLIGSCPSRSVSCVDCGELTQACHSSCTSGNENGPTYFGNIVTVTCTQAAPGLAPCNGDSCTDCMLLQMTYETECNGDRRYYFKLHCCKVIT